MANHNNYMRSGGGGRYDEEEIPKHCTTAADRAAEMAVEKTFAILGVDVNRPESVEEFRKDLRFGGRMRKYADHGTLVFIGVVAVAIAYAMYEGIISKFRDIGH